MMNKKEISRQQRHQVNVRLDDDLNNRLDELAIRTKKKKSELMRDAFTSELEKVVDKLDNTEYVYSKSLSEEDRKNVIITIGNVKDELRNMNKELGSIGNLYNQIAKVMNQSGAGVNINNERSANLLEHNYSKELDDLTKKVDALWHTFM